VVEAVQDVVEALYEVRNEYIKFSENEAEPLAATGTFEDLSGGYQTPLVRLMARTYE